MHPEITSRLAAQRRADMTREASTIRDSRLARGTGQAPSDQLSTATGRRAPGWLPRLLPGPARALARAGRRPAPTVFVAEPEAFGVRAYLTSQEARQVMAEWARQLACYADRLDDPHRRPAGAQPFELLILGRQVPALAPAATTGLSVGD
jgi:hypothetical protein